MGFIGKVEDIGEELVAFTRHIGTVNIAIMSLLLIVMTDFDTMAKKNLKHKEATKRKVEATAEMDKIGLKLDDDLKTIGLVFNHLAVSHMTYLGLNSINELCREHVGVDLCIFTIHSLPPCVKALCPVFSISDLSRWSTDPLVSTDIATTIEALATNASVVYHFCFDPEFIGNPNMESADLKSSFCDPRVRVVVRHDDHKGLVEEEFGIKVCAVIPDFDTEKLTKLIMDGDRQCR